MKRNILLKAGGSAAICIGLTAGSYGIASAATSGGTTTTSPTTAKPSLPAGKTAKKHKALLRGVITAVGSDTITIGRANGKSVTVPTTAATVYNRDGSPSSRSALAVGERVQIHLGKAAKPASPATGSTSSTSTPAGSTSAGSASSGSRTTARPAAAIDIVDPRIAGTVQSVTGQTLVIDGPDGFYRTVDLSGSTTYTDAGQPAGVAALTSGARVVAIGTVGSDHTSLDATKVEVDPSPATKATGSSASA